MPWQILMILPGLAGLYYGAAFLVKGGVGIGKKAGISPLVIGLTLVAYGTSAPELLVSLQAALVHAPDIAIGNVIGSNICNIGLILGLSAVITPLKVHSKIVRSDAPAMLIVTLVFAAILGITGGIGRIAGALLLIYAVLYTWKTVNQARNEEKRNRVPVREFTVKQLAAGEPGIWFSIFLAAGGLAVLALGSKLMVEGAVALARTLGVSDAVIGLTVVAVGTSLPELATSVVAALKKQQDIAVGNVIGSNLFNILFIMGAVPLISPVTANGVNYVDLAVMAGFALALLPMMRRSANISRFEGATLLIFYFAYIVFRCFNN